ncbi:MAG: hypothetical protein RQ748_05665, partial [Elusimicrobiales bacterium]|nr:hypothetical protein [Elusimicrobiales bacterium]
FGDLAHKPRHGLRSGVSRLRIPAPRAPEALAGARAAADLLLYAPGRRMGLALEAAEGFPGAARGLALYAVLKARRLGAGVKISLEARS